MPHEMKALSYLLTAVLSFLLLTGAYSQNSLHEFVANLEGCWIANPGADLEEEPLFIQLDRSGVEGDHVKVYISEYCQEGGVDFLLFELKGGQLAYFSGLVEGEFRDVNRIGFIYLRPKLVGGELLLTYEAEETEYSHYQYQELYRLFTPMEILPTEALALKSFVLP